MVEICEVNQTVGDRSANVIRVVEWTWIGTFLQHFRGRRTYLWCCLSLKGLVGTLREKLWICAHEDLGKFLQITPARGNLIE